MYPASRKLRCLERELKFRREVYPNLVRKGRMAPDAHKEEIAVMEAIADDYRRAAAAEQLPLTAPKEHRECQ